MRYVRIIGQQSDGYSWDALIEASMLLVQVNTNIEFMMSIETLFRTFQLVFMGEEDLTRCYQSLLSAIASKEPLTTLSGIDLGFTVRMRGES